MEADTDLAQVVAEALRRDPALSRADITVTSSVGQVTLEGTVASIAELRQAEIVAWNDSGTEAVINQIEVASHDGG